MVGSFSSFLYSKFPAELAHWAGIYTVVDTYHASAAHFHCMEVLTMHMEVLLFAIAYYALASSLFIRF